MWIHLRALSSYCGLRTFHFFAVLLWLCATAGAQQIPDSKKPFTRLESELQQLTKQLNTQHAATVAERVEFARGGKVPVTISSPDISGVRELLQELGAEEFNAAEDIIEAYVPLPALTSLDQHPNILSIRLIRSPVPLATSEGVSVHNAWAWQADGYRGAGIKVGVIDVGFQQLTSLLGVELPVNVVGRCYAAPGNWSSLLSACERGGSHGTAVAEAVVDIAPDIQLYIANPISSLDLHSTVAWMAAAGVRVINYSVAKTWEGPGDGTYTSSSSGLAAVDAAVSSGITWISAAGNHGQKTWTGYYADADGDNRMEFSTGDEGNRIYLYSGQSVVIQARWEDSWTAANRDLDLFLRDAYGFTVASSLDLQMGYPGEIPHEILSYTAYYSGYYQIGVNRWSGGIPGWIQVQVFSGPELQYRVPAFSIVNPAESRNGGMVAVGASPWSNPSVLESFSSRGPTRDARIKPDIVASDNANSATWGPWQGTSQASPHVAGLAALVLGRYPIYTPSQVVAYLKSSAQPRGSPNYEWGYGFAYLPTLPQVYALVPSALPAVVNTPMTWTAAVSGVTEGLEYQFWIYNALRGWVIARPYSPANSFTWFPSTAGPHAVQVWVRRIGASVSYDSWRGSDAFTVLATAPVTAVTLSANVPFPVQAGGAITWTASAQGTGNAEYQFWRSDNGVWRIVRPYSAVNTYSWTPTAAEAGTHALQVWARAVGSSATYEAYNGTGDFLVTAPPPPELTGLVTTTRFPAPSGSPITWTASATAQGLEFQFWRLDGEVWQIVQAYSTSTSYTWTPESNAAGVHAIQVWARLVGSTARYESYRGTGAFEILPFNLPPTLLSATLPAAEVSPGGVAELQVRFTEASELVGLVLVHQSGGTRAIQLANLDWRGDTTVRHLLLPEDLEAGSWRIADLRVRKGGSDGREYRFVAESNSAPACPVFDESRVCVSPVLRASVLTVSGTAPAATAALVGGRSADVVGTSFQWKATAWNGTSTEGFEYEYRIQTGSNWTLVGAASTDPVLSWVPAIGDAGVHRIQVSVRPVGSADFVAIAETGEFRVAVGSGPTRVDFATTADTMAPALTLQGVTFTATGQSSPGSSRPLLQARGTFAPGMSFQFIDGRVIQVGSDALSVTLPAPSRYLGFGVAINGTSAPTRLRVRLFNERGEGIGDFPLVAFSRAGNSEARFFVRGVGNILRAEVLNGSDGLSWDTRFHWVIDNIDFEHAPPAPSLNSLTADVGFPAAIGQTITWTAAATGGEGPLLYKFWRLDGGSWQMVQDYSSSATYSWTPGPDAVGVHAVQAWVRGEASTATYEDWRGTGYFEVRSPAPVVAVALSSNRAFPLATGTEVLFSAAASGGIGRVEYQFWRLDGSSWTIVQAYSPSATYSWTPSRTDAGRHALQVWARTIGSSAAWESYASTGFFEVMASPIVVSALVSDVRSPAPVGTSVTWTAVASGDANLLFKFWRLSAGVWRMVQDYSPTPSHTWTPSGADVGLHVLQVWVKSADSTAAYDAWRSSESFQVAAPTFTLTSLTASVSFPAYAGVPITWTAQSASPGLEYQFWRMDEGVWQIVQEYGPSNSYTWLPVASQVGTHALQVWARRNGSAAAYEVYQATGYFEIIASTNPVRWTLQDVQFDVCNISSTEPCASGGTADGYFVYDATTRGLLDWRITVGGGDETIFPPFVYSPVSGIAAVAGPNSLYQHFVFNGPRDGRGLERQLRLAFLQPLTDAGGAVQIDPANSYAGECYNCAPWRLLSAGSAAAWMRPESCGNWLAGVTSC